MTHDEELNELMQSIAERSLQLISNFKSNPEHIPSLISQFIDLTEYFQNLITIILQNPEKVWQMHYNYWEDAINLVQNQFTHWLEGKSLPIDDHRFQGENWLNNPFFNLLSQQYLLANEHMDQLLHNIDYEDQNTARKVRFVTKQYLNALSPANFAHTNPHVVAQTLQSRGKNLLRGLHNLLSDLEGDLSRINIKMTDSEGFKLGVNIAATPGEVIFRNEMIELIQYAPKTTKVKSIPLLIIPPWINKYYILDLSPHNSMVKWLVDKGITVFMISWINPDERYAKKNFFHYLKNGPISAIATIKSQLKVEQVNTLGFCIGGTLLTMLLAYNKARQDKSIKSATFLATLIDFSDPGDLAVFIDEAQVKKLEDKMSSKGYLDGKLMSSSFNALRSNDLIWTFFIKNYLEGANPVPFDILFWNADDTNMPATMHSQYLRWMYLQNDLVKPGKIRLNRTPIDVSTIDTPVFFLSTIKDHIAPWKTTYLGFQLMQGPKKFVLGGSGHIAGIINSPTVNKYGYRLNADYQGNADDWLESSVEHSGSWWKEWLKWLKQHSGSSINAPDLNHLPLKSIMHAPGSYVLNTKKSS